jgi:hypothetical protein
MTRLPPPHDVVAVYEATSEFEAIAIRDVLEAAGIPVMVRSRLVPGYEVPIIVGGEAGVYADIMVLPRDEEQASGVIAEYLETLRTGAVEEPQ